MLTGESRLSLALLLLRVVGAGSLALLHGWPKLADFAAMSVTFADPLGFGSRASLALTVFAEFFCALLVVLGMATRWAALPVLFTMLVAAFVVHAGDPLKTRELALVYAAIFATFTLTGGGRYALEITVRRGHG